TPHRYGDARDARTRARRAGVGLSSRYTRALHVGLHGIDDRLTRHRRARRGIPPEAHHTRRPGPHGARSARRSATPSTPLRGNPQQFRGCSPSYSPAGALFSTYAAMNLARPDTTSGLPAMGVDGKPVGPFAIEDRPLGAADRQAMEQPARQETAQALTSALHLSAVLEAIADQALSLIGAQRCAVFELDPLDARLKPRAARGMLLSQAFWPI